MPPGLIGTSVARLCVTWTRRTFCTLCSTPNASRKNQIVTNLRPSRRAATRRRCGGSATARGGSRRRGRTEHGSRPAAAATRSPVPVRRRQAGTRSRPPRAGGRKTRRSRSAQIGEEREPRQDAERERVGEQHHRERRVRYRHDDIGGGERGVGTSRYRTVREVQTHDVAGARDDGVHAHTDHVRAENGRPRDALVRIGGRDDVAPGPAGTGELDQVAPDRDQKRHSSTELRCAKNASIASRTSCMRAGYCRLGPTDEAGLRRARPVRRTGTGSPSRVRTSP